MPDITIRPATEADLPELARLWYEKAALPGADRRLTLLPDGRVRWTEAMRRRLADPSALELVAERDAVARGYLVAGLQPGPPGFAPELLCVITDMALDLHHYQGGLGRALVETARAWGKSHGAAGLVAQVPHRSAVEQAFWRSLGATVWADLMWLK